MKATLLLPFHQRHPRALRRWRTFPIFGVHVDHFVRWLHDRGYSDTSISQYWWVMPQVLGWLRRRKVLALKQLNLHLLQEAYHYYRTRNHRVSRAVRCLCGFLKEQKIVPEGHSPRPSASEVERHRFADYLRESRHLCSLTILTHTRRLRFFLKFIKFDHDPSSLRRLQFHQIEGFLHQAARTNSRISMQHVVATIRNFLRWKHEEGILSRPMHLQIDTPRVYRLERLPQTIPWTQVQAFLGSIDRSDALGQRDFTLLYLAAAYGLRSSELVGLTLDDIDWHRRTFRVHQRKTRQAIQLPLTDEAATVLVKYLRKARPTSPHRHLFLRRQAPAGPMAPEMVGNVLEQRIRLSGLKLPPISPHALRHSFAVHLLRQGVSMKSIGDVLGHREIESTLTYLRLDLEDLRMVALPVPTATGHSPPPSGSANYRPRPRAASFSRHLPKGFRSKLSASLQRFVRLKHTLGRQYLCEAAMLRRWDDFLHRRYSKARKVRPAMFFAWTQELAHLSSGVRRMYQRVVTNFLEFHARDHADTFIPDTLTFPNPTHRPMHRIVSVPEMARVLDAARKLPPSCNNPLRSDIFRLGFVLLFCCGLRSGELRRLTLGNIDIDQSLIQIANTKFHKSRLVPLAPSVAQEIQQYLQRRRALKRSVSNETFLLSDGIEGHKAYADHTLIAVWHQLCSSTHLLDGHGHRPRIHDLRHSFAANVLQRWYAEGADVQARLPHLATYLGHSDVASTHYYLQLTPEIRQSASHRFHQQFAPLLTAGGAL
jgi:site-specific recombinase XerD